LATCLAARASEGAGRAHWVREAGLCDDFCYLAEVRSIRPPPYIPPKPPSPDPAAHPPAVAPRLPATAMAHAAYPGGGQVLQLELTFPPALLSDTFAGALKRLVARGGVQVLYDDGYGQRVQLCTSPQARRLVSLLRRMLVPLLDAYWVAALSLLPLRMEAESGVLMGPHLDRMQRIARTMYLENKAPARPAFARPVDTGARDASCPVRKGVRGRGGEARAALPNQRRRGGRAPDESTKR